MGRTIAGKGEPFAKIPIFWSAREYILSGFCELAYWLRCLEGLRYCGLGGKANYDETVVKGNPTEGKVGYASTTLRLLTPPIT